MSKVTLHFVLGHLSRKQTVLGALEVSQEVGPGRSAQVCQKLNLSEARSRPNLRPYRRLVWTPDSRLDFRSNAWSGGPDPR